MRYSPEGTFQIGWNSYCNRYVASEPRAGSPCHERLTDRHIAGFLNELPPDLTPTDLQGMGRIHFKQDGVHYLGGYRCLATQETPNWLICILLPEADVMEQVDRSNWQTSGASRLGDLPMAAG